MRTDSAQAKEWLSLAQSCCEVTELVCHTHPRSAASRAYYAAFAACHAVLWHLRPTLDWPGRGNFRHQELPGELRWTLLHYLPKMGPFKVDIFRDLLETNYNLRRQADYRPTQHVGTDRVRDAVEAAKQMLRLAQGVVK